MAFEKQYIMDIDRENGQPLWWKNLIEAHTRRGYEVRFLNYFYTYRNETMNTSDRLEYWDKNDFSYYIKLLNSSINTYRDVAEQFFKKNIIFFLSRIDGVNQDSCKVDFDKEKRLIIIKFNAELENEKIEKLTLYIKY